MPTTPNMGLIEPVVSTTAGPTWATQLNTITDTIDAHDHTPGKGARVPTAGLNINADLSLGGNKATSVKGVVFSQVAVTDNGAIYAGTDGNLYYRDGSANLIQLTVNGGINIAASAITADLNLNGFRLIGFGSLLPTANAGAIATALALYVQTISSNGTLRWNDANGTALNLASAYAVDPPVVTVAAGNVSLAQSSNDQIVLVDTSAGRTITLPPPANFKKRIWIKDKTGQAQANPITIARNASEKIEGVAASRLYYTNWGGLCLVTDGTDWFVI